MRRKTEYLSCPKRIEVCGGIASGKTTFANLMKRIGLQPIIENYKVNPFWRAFYSEPDKYTFETEISFLLMHYHQIKKDSSVEKVCICDFSLIMDVAYAEVGLKGSKLRAFMAVYDEINNELLSPTLLVHLNCDAETELKRIRNRGRAVEKSINLEFLDSLNKAIEKQVSNCRNQINVISIDSAKKNFAEDESIRKELTDFIAKYLQQIS